MAFTVWLACCGGQASTPPASPASPPPVSTEERCRQQAKACSTALLTSTDPHAIDCMAEDAIAYFGRDQLVIALAAAKSEFERTGLSFERVEVDPPQRTVSSGDQLFAIVPTHVTMKVPQGHIASASYLLGVSKDGGATWRFVDGAGLRPDNVKKIFATFPPSLTLPTREKPQLLP